MTIEGLADGKSTKPIIENRSNLGNNATTSYLWNY
jgi:hypothetical protein